MTGSFRNKTAQDFENVRNVFQNNGEVYEPLNFQNLSLTDLSSDNENQVEQRVSQIDQYESKTYDGIDRGFNRFESSKKALDHNYNEIVHQGSHDINDNRSHLTHNPNDFVNLPILTSELIYPSDLMLEPRPKIENKSFENINVSINLYELLSLSFIIVFQINLRLFRS
jgi:hypothetical protein